VTYTPNANYFGADAFTYTVDDGNGGTAVGTVTVTVTSVNDAPVAVADAEETVAGGSVNVPVLGNDFDIDSPALTVAAITQGSHGSVVIEANHTVTYTANTTFVGVDTFTYTADDGAGGQAVATVTITVVAPPRIDQDLTVLYTFDEGSGTVVNDVSGVGTPLDLTIQSPGNVTWQTGALSLDAATLINSGGSATKITNAAQATNEVTLEAWVVPASLTQTGPARIFTLAQNHKNRSFSLEQGPNAGNPRDFYGARLRTTSTNNNGEPGLTAPAGSATLALTHVVYTRSATGQTALYIDGQQVSTGTTGGDFSNWNGGSEFALGQEVNGRDEWLGTLHLVAVYSRALTGGEVQQNFLAGAD
jgi:hypothetical protein